MISSLVAHRDETLPSILANSLASVMPGSRRAVGRALAGCEGARPSIDFPIHLRRLAETVGAPLGYTAEDIVARHTMLPLHSLWLTPTRHRRMLEAMLGDGPATPAALLGAHACRTAQHTLLRFCPACRAEEKKKSGSAWWHRTPQVRGVVWCYRHQCPLADSQFLRVAHWKSDYPRCHAAITSPLSTPPLAAKAYAEDVEWLLQANLPPSGDCVKAAYDEALRAAGFLPGRLKRRDFLEAFHASHADGYLSATGLRFDRTSPYAWPAKVVTSCGRCHPPIRHLHVVRFLGFTAAGFADLVRDCASRPRPVVTKGVTVAGRELLKREWANPAVSINEMARRLRIREQTVRTWASSLGLCLPRFQSSGAFEKRRSQMRRSWLRLRNSAVGMARTRALRWVSRNDGAWLRANLRSRASTAAERRVNWAQRDRMLASAVAGAVATIEKHKPFRRVCRHTIAEALGARNLIHTARGRLPRFMTTMGKATENGTQFAVRRIRSLRRAHPTAARWWIRDRASIERPLPKSPEIRRALGYAMNHSFRPCR